MRHEHRTDRPVTSGRPYTPITAAIGSTGNPVCGAAGNIVDLTGGTLIEPGAIVVTCLNTTEDQLRIYQRGW